MVLERTNQGGMFFCPKRWIFWLLIEDALRWCCGRALNYFVQISDYPAKEKGI